MIVVYSWYFYAPIVLDLCTRIKFEITILPVGSPSFVVDIVILSSCRPSNVSIRFKENLGFENSYKIWSHNRQSREYVLVYDISWPFVGFIIPEMAASK